MAIEPVKVGVVGMGKFGRLHASTLSGLAEAELVALVARRQDSLDAVQKDYPKATGYTDLDEAISTSGVKAWVVASSTETHVEITRKLLEAGATVMLEKPISEDLKEAESLAPFVKADSSNLMIGHILLFNSELLALRDEVKKRGPIQYISAFRHRGADHVHHFHGETPFHLTMVHDLYSVQALLGNEDPVKVTAQQHKTKDGAVDLALAQLQWKNGTIATFSAAFMEPKSVSHEGFDRMEVWGEGWMARMTPNPRPIEVWDDERLSPPMTLEIRADASGPTGMMAEELRCFLRIAAGVQKTPAGATYQDAMQVQRWLDRIVSAVK